jgi:hypothetical protein
MTMEASDFRQQYERLTDDELLSVWADREGVDELPASVLTEEMRKRKLLGDPLADARVVELKQGLAENKRRFQRGQRRIIRRVQVFVITLAVAIVGAIVVWLFTK